MKYQAIINEEEKCETNNFNSMDLFISSIENKKTIKIKYIEDGIEMRMSFSGINACAEYAETKVECRMGR